MKRQYISPQTRLTRFSQQPLMQLGSPQQVTRKSDLDGTDVYGNAEPVDGSEAW